MARSVIISRSSRPALTRAAAAAGRSDRRAGPRPAVMGRLTQRTGPGEPVTCPSVLQKADAINGDARLDSRRSAGRGAAHADVDLLSGRQADVHVDLSQHGRALRAAGSQP